MSQAAKDREKRRQINAIAIVLIIGLLGVTIYLLMANISSNKANTKLVEQIDLADSLNRQLDAEFQSAMQELDAKAAENEELREIIDQQKEQLTIVRNKIQRNIRRGKSTASMLKEAQAQIAGLRVKTNSFKVTIDSLLTDNADLKEYSQNLKTETVYLKDTIAKKDEAIAEKEEVIAIKEVEKRKVEEEKNKLADKVALGGVLKVRALEAQALKIRRSGKEKKTSYAKRVEKFSVCFNIIKNDLTVAGRNKLFLRIIDPEGKTIAVEQRGSGTFPNQDKGGAETQYTASKSFEYNNDAPQICIDWIQEEKLTVKGEYKFEIYNKGYLAGSKLLKLK